MMQEKKKRVAHFIRKILPATASFIRNQILSHINYKPFLIFKEHTNSSFAHEIESNCNHLFLEEQKTGFEKRYSSFLYDKFKKITSNDVTNALQYLKNNNIQLLHFHYGSDARMYLEIIKSSIMPSIVSFYGYDCSSFPLCYFGYGKHLLQGVFRNIDFAIAMSDNMKKDLMNVGCPEDKIIVHYYGADVKNFIYKREYIDKMIVTLLIVSSLDEKKGHINVLKALEKMKRPIESKIQFRIVGNGPLENELRRYTKKHGLDEIVTFTGPLRYLSKEFLQEFYNADIFVHPSVIASNGDKEGIPGTIVEAMATGLPVISTYHAGIPYIIRNGETGILVNEHDVSALAQAIVTLAKSPELRESIGQEAQQYALENLDLHKKEVELESIYDFVVEKHSRRYR